MRRVLMILSVVALGLAGTPPQAQAAKGEAVCEGYCVTVAAGCYVFVGFFAGKDKCDAMYEGCVAGCKAGLEEG